MAIKFEKIKEGMVLYDVRKKRSFSLSMRKWEHWPVKVLEVDPVLRRVFMSWNSNPPKWVSENSITKYRAKLPEEL